jgi:hypothetical protein
MLVRDRSTCDDLDENERTFVWGFDDGNKHGQIGMIREGVSYRET